MECAVEPVIIIQSIHLIKMLASEIIITNLATSMILNLIIDITEVLIIIIEVTAIVLEASGSVEVFGRVTDQLMEEGVANSNHIQVI
jgi:hypothetical protein